MEPGFGTPAARSTLLVPFNIRITNITRLFLLEIFSPLKKKHDPNKLSLS